MTTRKRQRKLASQGETKLSATELLGEASALLREGDRTGAERSYRRAIRIDRNCVDAWRGLGHLLEDALRIPEAAACLRRVLELSQPALLPQVPEMLQEVAARPGWSKGQYQLGLAYWHLGEQERARFHLANALWRDPALVPQVYAMYAKMRFDNKEWTEAIADADRALAVNPQSFLANMVRSQSLDALALIPEAIESMRKTLEIVPAPDLHSSLLFDLNYLAEATPEVIYAEACRWNALHAAPLAAQIRPHFNSPDPERRIRLGYLSPDLYDHAIMKFLPPVFERHDRSRFELFVYAVGSKVDPKIGKSLEHYVHLPESAEEIAERIRADQVDILVDLAGHTMGRAFLALALKPAPVQVSWLGCVFTSGLATMDYFLGNRSTPAPGTEPFFTETVCRMPRAFYCYRPFFDIPIAPSPCLERGYITFGSLNNPRKINREVVKLWSAILHLVPESRLLLKYGGMETPALQNRYRKWFAEDGICGDRLRFAGASRADEYLQTYGEIDIALDPFPYNGGSTTLDTLWMGVPIVTLTGRLAVQCSGAEMLHAIGLADSVAETPERYLEAALFLAGIVRAVPELRRNIRQALKFSPLMDEIGLVRDLEDTYRTMWHAWCAKVAGRC